MLNRMIEKTVNAACPAANEITAGADAGDQDDDREQRPEQRVARAQHADDRAADREPDDGPAECPRDGRAGRQRVRAQDRQRAEPDPEGVLRIDESREQHRQRQSDGTADAVLQPDRVPVEVAARPAAARPRAGPARRSAVAGRSAAPTTTGSRPPRSRTPSWPRARRCTRARARRTAAARTRRRSRSSSRRWADARNSASVSRVTASRACSSSAIRASSSTPRGLRCRVSGLRQRGAAAGHHAGRGRAQPLPGRRPLLGRVGAGVRHGRRQPFDLLDEPDEQPRPGAEGRRPCRRRAERLAQVAVRLAHRDERIPRPRLGLLQRQHRGQRAAQGGRPLPEHVLVLRRPDEQRHGHRDERARSPSRPAGPAGPNGRRAA